MGVLQSLAYFGDHKTRTVLLEDLNKYFRPWLTDNFFYVDTNPICQILRIRILYYEVCYQTNLTAYCVRYMRNLTIIQTILTFLFIWVEVLKMAMKK
jgi:hypothetical protein